MFKIVLFVTFSVLCMVHSQSDYGYGHSRSYTRVKRGKYFPSHPLRFYSRPPMSFPIRGPFSYTPPPFMQDDEPPYPGSRPYKVSKRPTNDGLGDDDINNLVKNLSKQDLDKIIEFAYEKDKDSGRSKDIEYEYNRIPKRENHKPPPYVKDYYNNKYSEEKPYEMEFNKYINYVSEATPVKYMSQEDMRNSYPIDTTSNQVTFYGPQDDRQPPNNIYSFASQASAHPFKAYEPQDDMVPTANIDSIKNFESLQPTPYPGSTPSEIPETTEEEKLPPPINMREIDFDVSYTNNVPTVVKADPDSYEVESFGDLPLMNYNSKLHSVSSYHVPHYTVTQPKSQSLPMPPSSAYSSQSYSSSSSGLKPSPAAASIKAPPVEPAPPPSAAKEQSDAHLKAIKIWSHKSKGAAYTLHDDGTLTPEWPRPKYG